MRKVFCLQKYILLYYVQVDFLCIKVADHSSSELRVCVSVDDDSEPLLGLWFEETISVPDTTHTTQPGSEVQDSSNKATSTPDTTGSIVPEKGEPNGVWSSSSVLCIAVNTLY